MGMIFYVDRNKNSEDKLDDSVDVTMGLLPLPPSASVAENVRFHALSSLLSLDNCFTRMFFSFPGDV